MGWACRTRVPNFSVLSLKNGVKIWTFVCKLAKMSRIRYFLQIAWFCVGSSFFARLWLMLNTGRSDLRCFWRKVLQVYLGARPTESCKVRRDFFSPPLGKSLNMIDKWKAYHWSIRGALLETARGRYFCFGHVTLFHWSWASL